MVNSIQHFCQEGVKNLEKVMMDYSSDMTRIAEMVQGVQKGVLELGRSIIAEELEGYDEILRERRQLRPDWQIVKRDETTLLTILGSITYRKTLFKNKNTGQREYLLDRVMGLEKHARMTEDAEAALLKEAVQTSYEKGGEHATVTQETVSKETVMNKIHALRFPEAEPVGKKQVRYLYVDADEDHVSLQYLEKKEISGNREPIRSCRNWFMFMRGFPAQTGGMNSSIRDISAGSVRQKNYGKKCGVTSNRLMTWKPWKRFISTGTGQDG